MWLQSAINSNNLVRRMLNKTFARAELNPNRRNKRDL
jgi:hypothetical protein